MNDQVEQSVKRTKGGQFGNTNGQAHGHYTRSRSAKRKGFNAIDGRTFAGQQARKWRAWAIQQKGGAACPFDVLIEIERAATDLWLEIELSQWIARDAKERGAVLLRRHHVLPPVHDQFAQVCARRMKRCEALALDTPTQLDLARRLQIESMQNNGGNDDGKW